MGRIRAIITDFDGTLVNTFMANFLAYKEAFTMAGYHISKFDYQKLYGLRFDALCDALNIQDNDDRKKIKKYKAELYPSFFQYLTLNQPLVDYISYLKTQGIKTAIASTASKKNLYNVLNYFNLADLFDIIITGEDVSKGKPNPEVYLKAMALLEVDNDEVLIFEDSETGIEAAENAEASYIKINI